MADSSSLPTLDKLEDRDLQVTTDADRLERECKASCLTWPKDHWGTPRIQNLGRRGVVTRVDHFDGTVKLHSIGWVPIGAIQGFEEFGTGNADDSKGDESDSANHEDRDYAPKIGDIVVYTGEAHLMNNDEMLVVGDLGEVVELDPGLDNQTLFSPKSRTIKVKWTTKEEDDYLWNVQSSDVQPQAAAAVYKKELPEIPKVLTLEWLQMMMKEYPELQRVIPPMMAELKTPKEIKEKVVSVLEKKEKKLARNYTRRKMGIRQAVTSINYTYTAEGVRHLHDSAMNEVEHLEPGDVVTVAAQKHFREKGIWTRLIENGYIMKESSCALPTDFETSCSGVPPSLITPYFEQYVSESMEIIGEESSASSRPPHHKASDVADQVSKDGDRGGSALESKLENPNDFDLYAASMMCFVNNILSLMKKKDDFRNAEADCATRTAEELAMLADVGEWDDGQFISQRPLSIDHIEDIRGENWVVHFAQPTLTPNGNVAKTIWYSCTKHGHDCAKDLAFRHVPRTGDKVATSGNAQGAGSATSSSLTGAKKLQREEMAEDAGIEAPNKKRRYLRMADLVDIFK